MTALIQRYEKQLQLNVLAITRSIREVMATLSLMAVRQRQRRQLLELDDWQLEDLGLSREQVLEEAAKPFWV